MQGNKVENLPKELALTALGTPNATFKYLKNPLTESLGLVLESRKLSGLFELMRKEDYEKALEIAAALKRRSLEAKVREKAVSKGALYSR
jgi:hypothetical protein